VIQGAGVSPATTGRRFSHGRGDGRDGRPPARLSSHVPRAARVTGHGPHERARRHLFHYNGSIVLQNPTFSSPLFGRGEAPMFSKNPESSRRLTK